jgi:hypothetical protein
LNIHIQLGLFSRRRITMHQLNVDVPSRHIHHQIIKALLTLLFAVLYIGTGWAQVAPTWRYYRLGNTGMQGDYIDALWVGPDGDPYMGGYDPVFEEGGFTKFIQGENRWINYSNVDYQVIGHPNETGCTRVRDIVPDVTGKLWLGTWRGALTFDPSIGASSLVRLGPGNSGLIDDFTWDIDRAPDSTMWFVNGGIVRYNPATNIWTRWSLGEPFMSVQPKSTGGYLVWSSERPPFQSYTFIFDSDTQQWDTINVLYPNGNPGDIAGMPGKDCVDDAGNFWALRLRNPGDFDALDYRKPDGTWVSPTPPYPAVTFSIGAFKAYADRRAILTDGLGDVYQFNGSNWVSLGAGGVSAISADVDALGNVWVSGVGGAAKRNAQTGQWQRYRVTNTSDFDDFNRDLTIDPVNNYIYTGANAAPGVGGMVRFDGTRWTCWDQLTYGLGYDWPFGNDYCQALAYRPSNGRVAVNPYWFNGIYEWTGSTFNTLRPDGEGGAKRMCEDSQGRLWAIGEYFSLSYYDGGTWHSVPITAWGSGITKDPTRPGTVWAWTGYEFVRTDGTYRFSRTIADFPELTDNTDQFLGLAVDTNGIAWVGATDLYGGATPGGVLIRIDANTGAYQMIRSSQGWPFPGDAVTPWVVTPDGRLWMQYDDSNYPYTEMGLCWYNGTNVGSFPAPPEGEPQWGGLPHRQIEDIEVRMIPEGYELWMSCVSRGIAVLTVPYGPTSVSESPTPSVFLLAQNYPNPFNPSTTISYQLPSQSHVTLKVFDLLGREVVTVVDGVEEPGHKSVRFDGRNLASGTYFYQLRAGAFVDSKRFLLLR